MTGKTSVTVPPEVTAMPNDRLKEALTRSALTTGEVANKLAVDPKTVERWVTAGRIPYPRYRRQISTLVQESEGYLWPEAIDAVRRDQLAESEIVHVYPHRASLPSDHWRRLIEGATQSIDLLMFSGMFLVDEHPKLGALLRSRAEAGVRIRVLAGDPASEAVRRRGIEEGIEDALAAKIRNVLVHYRDLEGVEGAEVRLHGTTLYNSIYRFDEEMLVNAHVYGFPAAYAPVLHLRRLSEGVLFDTYAESFKQVWTAAAPAWARAGESAAATAG